MTNDSPLRRKKAKFMNKAIQSLLFNKCIIRKFITIYYEVLIKHFSENNNSVNQITRKFINYI